VTEIGITVKHNGPLVPKGLRRKHDINTSSRVFAQRSRATDRLTDLQTCWQVVKPFPERPIQCHNVSSSRLTLSTRSLAACFGQTNGPVCSTHSESRQYVSTCAFAETHHLARSATTQTYKQTDITTQQLYVSFPMGRNDIARPRRYYFTQTATKRYTSGRESDDRF